ncbi:MAG: 4Fe-4S dicluster domain-containing protein [Planctomycetota bacterium]
MNRREFIAQTILGALGAAGVLALMRNVRTSGPSAPTPQLAARGRIRPPHSLAEPEFLAKCIRCQRCSQVCEPRAIRLYGEGTGVQEGTPYLVPELTGCTLCLKCGESCPTGAIPYSRDKASAGMGTAVIDEQLCVSHNGTGICGACYTVCPLRGKAIRQGSHHRPTIVPAVCVGCGMCEEACIVKRDKAIRVHSTRRWA